MSNKFPREIPIIIAAQLLSKINWFLVDLIDSITKLSWGLILLNLGQFLPNLSNLIDEHGVEFY